MAKFADAVYVLHAFQNKTQKTAQSDGWTQLQAAKHLGITQPRVSKLTKGVWQDFSLDMLLTLAARAGMRPELRLAV